MITSGNFTENGLLNNHEYGLCVEDEEMQKQMADTIMSINTYDLSYIQLCEIYNDALKFIEKHPLIQQEKFKINKLINRKPSATQNGTVKYYIKPIGTSENHFKKEHVLNNIDKFGFGNNPKEIQKGDVLLLHGVGPSSIVGYYIVTSDEAVYEKWNDEDRWPWKVEAECYSLQFSTSWWNYELKTQNLVDEFLEQKTAKEHITQAGGDTLGALQWGRDNVQITKEFAQFIIGQIPD